MNTTTLNSRVSGLLIGLVLICSSPPQLSADPGGTGWASGFDIPGVNGTIHTLLRRGDTLYVGGDVFQFGGSTFGGGWGMMDFKTGRWYRPPWQVSGIIANNIYALAEDASGNIYMGGDFTTAAGADSISYILKWDGVQVSTLSGVDDQLDGPVRTLKVVGDRIFVGGTFTQAGDGPAEGLAVWSAADGWQELGGGLFRSGPPVEVNALERSGDTLFVGGAFQRTGFQIVGNLGRYEISTDTWLPAWGEPNGTVYALMADEYSVEWELYVGGDFDSLSGMAANNVARFGSVNGWRPILEGTNGTVRTFDLTRPSGIIMGGDFTTASGMSANHIVRYSRGGAETFHNVAHGTDGPVYDLLLDDELNWVTVAGDFELSDSVQTKSLAHLNYIRSQFLPTSHGIGQVSPKIYDMVSVKDTLYAAGDFNFAGGIPANYVAMWAPGDLTWTALGQGPTPIGAARHIAAGGGRVYVAGSSYDTTDGLKRTGIQMWDGFTWQILPGPFLNTTSASSSRIDCLEVDPLGNLYVGGFFDMIGSVNAKSIAMWDGAQWIDLRAGFDTALTGGAIVADIAWDTTTQSLYVVGRFSRADNVITPGAALWDGSDWTAIGSASLMAAGGPTNVEVDATGGVYISGRFFLSSTQHSIYKWDGAAFTNIGASFASAIHDMQAIGCELYVAGKFLWVNNGSVVANRIARYDGTLWHAMGTGMTFTVNALAVSEWADDDIRLYAGGEFSTVDGGVANRISYWHVDKLTDCASNDRQLVVKAYDNQRLGNLSFLLFKVFNDRPVFSQQFLDTVFSDDNGQIDLSEYLESGALVTGDTLRLSTLVHTEPSLVHPNLNQYSIELDNMVFDALGYASYKDVLNNSASQTIILGHTTVAFNLIISLEWDSALPFLDNAKPCFRKFSNYLYDVSDGQMRLDTVYVYDDKQAWDFADMRIHASNMVWPHVNGVGGIDRGVNQSKRPMEMPRRWFGKQDVTRKKSHSSHPLDISTGSSPRVMAHEFGHYGLYLKDEYTFVIPDKDAERCASTPNYGFMDGPYISNGIYSSEMSSAIRYVSESCQNNRQWKKHEESCWETIEAAYERSYNSVPVQIIRPGERTLASGFDFLPGPFDSTTNVPNNVSYDVGALVIFPITHSAPAASDLEVIITKSDGSPITGFAAVAIRSVDLVTFREIYQGLPTDDGRIWALGVPSAGAVVASGWNVDVIANRLAAQESAPIRKWLYGEATIGGTGVSRRGNKFASYGASDSLVIALLEVQGDFNLVSKSDITPVGFLYTMFTSRPFPAAPLLEHMVDGVFSDSASMNPMTGGYSITLDDSLGESGEFRIQVQDDSGATFFFPVRYSTSNPDYSESYEVMGPEGAIVLNLDSSASTLSKILISSSAFPVLRSGLDPLAVQAGDAHSIAFQPGSVPAGGHHLTMRYADDEISAGAGLFGEETQLRAFKWNEVLLVWELAGGAVDTVFNEVTVEFLQTGTYALFTTDISTSIGSDPTGSVLPKHFELHPNRPNPFNPATTISYTLARPGHVRLSVYNTLGQHVTTLVDIEQAAGQFEVKWDGTNKQGTSVASGVYFYRLDASGQRVSRKMLLLR